MTHNLTALKLPLPPPMKSNIPGTWAYDTMSSRISRDIFPRLIQDNADRLNSPTSVGTSDSFMQLNDLKASLDCGKSGYLRDLIDNAPDAETWTNILATQKAEERNWLDADWVIAEFYFYRRVAEAFRYFETGYDFFQKQKIDGLLEAMPSIESVTAKLGALVKQEISVVAKIAVLTSLWGNKMDLSLWPASSQESNNQGRMLFGDALSAGKEYILDDQTDDVVSLLSHMKLKASGSREISVVVDNAGYELFSDLLLGHLMLETGCCDRIIYHTKAHPTFVSDATTADLIGTADLLSCITGSNKGSNSLYPASNEFGRSLLSHLSAGRIIVQDDLFWCQPTAFWDMPSSVVDKIKNSGVVFVKGDANYRRLLGERQWSLDTPARDILSYWPVPVCALRTFKAEIGCGVSPSTAARAVGNDSRWMVSGKWGVVQLGGKTTH